MEVQKLIKIQGCYARIGWLGYWLVVHGRFHQPENTKLIMDSEPLDFINILTKGLSLRMLARDQQDDTILAARGSQPKPSFAMSQHLGRVSRIPDSD